MYADGFEELGVAAIGFNAIGDVTGKSREQIAEEVKGKGGPNESGQVGQVFRFAHEMKVGDLVVVPIGETRQLLYGTVEGDYVWCEQAPIAHFHHTRPVKFLGRRDRDALPDRILFSLGGLLTVFMPKGQETLRAYLLSGQIPAAAETADSTDETSDGTEEPTSAADQEARNREVIASKIAELGWREAQQLVAGLLRAMDYHIHVAADGADGGIDVRAARDALFLQPPIIKVQVKARPRSRTPPADVRALGGVLENDERGIFVSTGGFTAPAESETERYPRIQLWGMDRLVDLLLEHYDRLGEDSRALVRLKRIWVLDDSRSS